jgi:cardiolipin synthase
LNKTPIENSPPPHPSPIKGEGAFNPILAAAHRFEFLPTGAAAIAALEALIRQAQKSLCLEMYIYKADATGDAIRAALLDACERGVRVRILLDDFGSANLPNTYFSDLLALGAELRTFNPQRVLRIAFRNHRKLCIVDDRQAIVGGFNIADEYNRDGVEAGWRDLGMRIDGPVVDELEATFNRMFIGAHADTRAVIAFTRGLTKPPMQFDAPALLTVGPGFESEQLRQALHRDIRNANRVAIVAAYFTPPWRLRRAMRKAARRGIVRVILPGVSDVPPMRFAAHHLYERMLRHRIEIFEYQPQILHSKLVVIDDAVYVGSSNFDVRSLQLNYDFLIRIPSAELAAQARRLVNDHIAHSSSITLPEWHSASGYWQRVRRFVWYWLATRFDPFLVRRKWRTLR